MGRLGAARRWAKAPRLTDRQPQTVKARAALFARFLAQVGAETRGLTERERLEAAMRVRDAYYADLRLRRAHKRAAGLER
jgi:hypothetical protein